MIPRPCSDPLVEHFQAPDPPVKDLFLDPDVLPLVPSLHVDDRPCPHVYTYPQEIDMLMFSLDPVDTNTEHLLAQTTLANTASSIVDPFIPKYLLSCAPYTKFITHINGKVEKTWYQKLSKIPPQVDPVHALDTPSFRVLSEVNDFSRDIIQATHLFTEGSPVPTTIDLCYDLTCNIYLPSGLALNTLFDTGSQKCLLSKDFYEKHLQQFANFQTFSLQASHTITVGDGNTVKPSQLILLPLIIQGNHFSILALIVQILPHFDFIMGHEAFIQLEASSNLHAPNISVTSKSIPLYVSRTVTIPAHQTSSLHLFGRLPTSFSGGEAIIHVLPVQINYSISTIIATFVNHSTLIRIENASTQPMSFSADEPIAFFDLRAIGYYQPPVCLATRQHSDVCLSTSCLPSRPPDLPLPELPRKLQDPFPWLDSDDLRRFMSDQQILEQAIDLSTSSLTKSQRQQFLALLLDHRAAFSLREEIGLAPDFQVTLELTDTTPFFIRPFHVKEDMKSKIDKEMLRLVHLGILRKGLSGYSSPVMAIPRKNSDIPRIVTDFRHLNSKLVTVNHTFTLIRDVIQTIGASQCQVMSVIDLKDAYHTLRLHPDSQKYCGITPYYGADSYLYTRLGMGLKVAPTIWQSFINSVLGDLPNRNHYVAIMDDCLVFSKFDDHLQDLTNLFKSLIKHGLKISPRKCQFFRTSLVYMGLNFLIKDDRPSFTPMKDKCASIRALRPPTTVTDCRKFCGMVNFLSTFLPKLQQTLIPIYNLTRKNTPFRWSSDCQKAFDTIKEQLASPPILTMPRLQGMYRLMSDTSRQAAGAALYQQQGTKYYLVGYNSKKLPKAALNYSVTELELTGMCINIYSFRQPLTNIYFQVFVDHSAITHIFNSTKMPPTRRIQRLIEHLLPFNFTVHFLNGNKMHIADILSRLAGKDLEPPDKIIPISFLPAVTRGMTRRLSQSPPKPMKMVLKQPRIRLTKCDAPTNIPPPRKQEIVNVDRPLQQPVLLRKFAPPRTLIKPQPTLPLPEPRKTLVNPKLEIPQQLPLDLPVPPKETLETYRPLEDYHTLKPLPLLKDAAELDIFTRHIPKQVEIDKFLKVLKSKVRNSYNLPVQIQDLAQAYLTSPAFAGIYKYIKNNVLPSHKRAQRTVLTNAEHYFIANDLLFRVHRVSGPTLTGNPYRTLLVIPEKYEPALFHTYHDSLLGAHYNPTNTFYTIRTRFWVNNLFEKLQRYIGSCESCLKHKPKKDMVHTYFPRIPLEYNPLAHLSGDIKYMPLGIYNYKYLLILVCEITNFIIAIPLVNIDAISIAHALLDRVVFVFGPPQSLIIDEDRALSSKVMHYLFDAIKTSVKIISPYNHGSLRTERFIQTLSNLITRRLTTHGKEWPLYVVPTCWAMNSVVSMSTGFSPYELVFLKKPPDITNLYFSPLTEVAKGYREYCAKMRERFRHVSHAVTELRALAQQKQAVQQEAKHTESLPPGRLVYLLAPSAASLQTNTRKCRADFVGPLSINRLYDATHYVLQDIFSGKIIPGIYHINRLKKAEQRTPKGIVTTYDAFRQATNPELEVNPVRLPDIAPAAVHHILYTLNVYRFRSCDTCNTLNICYCE